MCYYFAAFESVVGVVAHAEIERVLPSLHAGVPTGVECFWDSAVAMEGISRFCSRIDVPVELVYLQL